MLFTSTSGDEERALDGACPSTASVLDVGAAPQLAVGFGQPYFDTTPAMPALAKTSRSTTCTIEGHCSRDLSIDLNPQLGKA